MLHVYRSFCNNSISWKWNIVSNKFWARFWVIIRIDHVPKYVFMLVTGNLECEVFSHRKDLVNGGKVPEIAHKNSF